MGLQPALGFATMPERIGTLLLTGGPGATKAAGDREFLAWLNAVSPRCERLGSVCNGAWILAASGLAR